MQSSVIKSVFDALPAAATGPFAFVAYVGAVVASTYFMVRYVRMRTIALLPPDDRARALARETHHADARKGLSAEQWLRHQKMLYLLYGVLSIVGAVVVIVVVAIVTARAPIVRPDTSTYKVVFFSKPDGADVTINGQWVGETPFETSLVAGKYNVMLKKDGYRARTRLVDIPQQSLVSEILEAR